jgi:hypothetical protein
MALAPLENHLIPLLTKNRNSTVRNICVEVYNKPKQNRIQCPYLISTSEFPELKARSR